MNNIVFFDIDGTLVSETDYSIPDSTLKALKLLKDKGNLAFINTGRPLSEISNNIRNLNFDGFVCGCGTYLEYKGKELFHKSFGKKLSAEVTRDILKYNFEAILEGKNGVYFDKEENIKDKTVIKLINQHKIEGFYKGTKEPSLKAMHYFMNKYNNFEKEMKFIHIAGTNGKGSCAEIVSNILNFFSLSFSRNGIKSGWDKSFPFIAIS